MAMMARGLQVASAARVSLAARTSLAGHTGPSVITAPSSRTMASFYDHTLQSWVDKPLQPVRLMDLVPLRDPSEKITQEQLISNAAHVRESVAIRVARRIQKIHNLSFIVGISPSMNKLFNLYMEAFNKLIEKPEPTNAFQELQLSKKLFPQLLDSTSVVLPTLSRATKDVNGLMSHADLAGFMDSMLIGRIYRRAIVANHLKLREDFENQDNADVSNTITRSVGIPIDTDLAAIAESTFTEHTRPVIMNMYGCCPELVVTSSSQPSILYIPAHVEVMLMELFKNAATATIEAHREKDELPPIAVSVFVSPAGDASIRITDRGGGVSESKLDVVFNYGYSALDPSVDTSDPISPQLESDATFEGRNIAGDGFGLPMIKQYANFFGGDVRLQPVMGLGTDAYLYLPDLSKRSRDMILQIIDF